MLDKYTVTIFAPAKAGKPHYLSISKDEHIFYTYKFGEGAVTIQKMIIPGSEVPNNAPVDPPIILDKC